MANGDSSDLVQQIVDQVISGLMSKVNGALRLPAGETGVPPPQPPFGGSGGGGYGSGGGGGNGGGGGRGGGGATPPPETPGGPTPFGQTRFPLWVYQGPVGGVPGHPENTPTGPNPPDIANWLWEYNTPTPNFGGNCPDGNPPDPVTGKCSNGQPPNPGLCANGQPPDPTTGLCADGSKPPGRQGGGGGGGGGGQDGGGKGKGPPPVKPLAFTPAPPADRAPAASFSPSFEELVKGLVSRFSGGA
jgi:hypothetical protein